MVKVCLSHSEDSGSIHSLLEIAALTYQDIFTILDYRNCVDKLREQ